MPGARGTPGLEMALVGTPTSWLVGLVAAGVHRVHKSASPPSGSLSLVW